MKRSFNLFLPALLSLHCFAADGIVPLKISGTGQQITATTQQPKQSVKIPSGTTLTIESGATLDVTGATVIGIDSGEGKEPDASLWTGQTFAWLGDSMSAGGSGSWPGKLAIAMGATAVDGAQSGTYTND